MAIPRIETARLILRGWELRDFEPLAAMSADPEVMRHLGGVLDRGESWRRMAMYIGHWVLRGYGNWVVERKSDGAMLGRAGLWNPEGWPGLEVGWKLARHAWGCGYATEAGRAALEWAWSVLDPPELISVIQPRNAASIRVAERLGMRLRGDATVAGEAVETFVINRPTSASAATWSPLPH